MATRMFEIHAGDFKACCNQIYRKRWKIGLFLLKKRGKFSREKIGVDQIDSLEIASEENVKRLEGTIGWGVAGGLLLGPVGLLAGLLAGGKSKDVTFICKFKDGRKFLATAPAKVYTEIMAARF